MDDTHCRRFENGRGASYNNKGSFCDIRPGVVIYWFNDDFGYRRRVRTVVAGTRLYKSFREYLSRETLSKCLPAFGITTIRDGVKVYRKFYTSCDEKQHGVLAIRLSTAR